MAVLDRPRNQPLINEVPQTGIGSNSFPTVMWPQDWLRRRNTPVSMPLYGIGGAMEASGYRGGF